MLLITNVLEDSRGARLGVIFDAAVESQRKFPFESIDAALAAAVEHHRSGRIDDAEKIYRQILVQQPTNPHALYLMGVAYGQRGRFAEAVDLISLAIQRRGDIPQFHCQLAEFQKHLKRYDEAVASLRRAVAMAEHDPAIHNALGAIFGEMRQFEAAKAEFRRSIELKPDFADSHSNLGAALVATGALDEAVAELETALRLNPDMPGAHLNLGNALYNKGLIRAAIEQFNKVLSYAPEDAKTHANLALAYLLLGDYPRGWLEHEWRLKVREIAGTRQFSQPRWNGEDIRGKSILLHREQGLGDFIQFARFIPMVAARGGRVVLEAPAELARLMRHFPGVSEMVQPEQTLPAIDVQCPLLSLGYVFGTRAETIPAQVPYIRCDPALSQIWKRRFEQTQQRLRIGLVWAGRPTHENERNRSIALAQFAPLAAVESCSFFSLQKGAAAAEAHSEKAAIRLTDWTDDLTDFADTAALIDHLNLVVTVDTAVAHLAGAMGKPVWILLPWVSDWRWMRDRDDSPWYPSARLFRQSRIGDWSEVLQTVAAAIQNEWR